MQEGAEKTRRNLQRRKTENEIVGGERNPLTLEFLDSRREEERDLSFFAILRNRQENFLSKLLKMRR